MIKLALVGKNIQHSKSPEIYRALLGKNIQYDLLDFPDQRDIPKALELLSLYDGVSITSPYKKHFLPEIKMSHDVGLLGAINCLRKKEGIIEGENTDFLAIDSIVLSWLKEFGKINVIILGDGVMSDITQKAMVNYSSIDYQVVSRKTTDNFAQVDLAEIFQSKFSAKNQQVVINTCSRDYIFKGQIDQKTIFWDYNYNFPEHSLTLPIRVFQYNDGLKMLELQARHALAFWFLAPSI